MNMQEKKKIETILNGRVAEKFQPRLDAVPDASLESLPKATLAKISKLIKLAEELKAEGLIVSSSYGNDKLEVGLNYSHPLNVDREDTLLTLRKAKRAAEEKVTEIVYLGDAEHILARFNEYLRGI